jgi:ABC-type lipoprotein export system ATPase subunit
LKEPGYAVLVVTHDPRVTGFGDRIIYIEDGWPLVKGLAGTAV